VTGDELALGRNVRRLREDRGMAIRELAELSQVSSSFVSQVERGVASPSVASLRRIAEALGTSIGALFDGKNSLGKFIAAKDRPRMLHPDGRWEDFLLTPQSARRLQVILSVIESGEGSGEEPYTHDSDEECVIVLTGSLEFHVGDETYTMNEGDSLTFESRQPHWNRNPSASKTEVLWITSPPSY
jgi:transcriptional regulator with XRE-family HTH domain